MVSMEIATHYHVENNMAPNFLSLQSLMGRILPIIHCTSLHCWKLLRPFAHNCQHLQNQQLPTMLEVVASVRTALNNEPLTFYFYFKTIRTHPVTQDSSPVMYKVNKTEKSRNACNRAKLCFGVTFSLALSLLINSLMGNFRSEDKDDYDYEFSVLSTRTLKTAGFLNLMRMLSTENS